VFLALFVPFLGPPLPSWAGTFLLGPALLWAGALRPERL